MGLFSFTDSKSSTKIFLNVLGLNDFGSIMYKVMVIMIITDL